MKFCNHPSVSAIKNAFNPPQNVRLIRQNADIFWSYICNLFNVCINKGTSPSILKHTNIIPVFKIRYRGSRKATEQLVFCLPSPKVSKSCYAIIYHLSWVSFYPNTIVAFRKRFSAEYCLLTMLENWKTAVKTTRVFGVFLTDLSKALNCLSHDLVIARFNAYGFSLPALNLVRNYLAKRKQRTKLNDSYSSWSDKLFWVPQGSSYDNSCFYIYLNDLSVIAKDVNIASNADNTLYDSAIVSKIPDYRL